jgi:hypothetical protein
VADGEDPGPTHPADLSGEPEPFLPEPEPAGIPPSLGGSMH